MILREMEMCCVAVNYFVAKNYWKRKNRWVGKSVRLRLIQPPNYKTTTKNPLVLGLMVNLGFVIKIKSTVAKL